jgi:hypothetical protein
VILVLRENLVHLQEPELPDILVLQVILVLKENPVKLQTLGQLVIQVRLDRWALKASKVLQEKLVLKDSKD